MTNKFLTMTLAGALATGLMFAQTAPTEGADRPARGRWHKGRMGADLNLTDSQKEQAKSIFSASRDQAKPLMQQLRDARKALNDAAKSGAPEAEIDRLANSLGPIQAQLAAVQSKAFAKFYALLTPEQRTKVGDRTGRMGGARFKHKHRGQQS